MKQTFFVKLRRTDDSLEKLLCAIRGRGADVVEMSARASLDNSVYFVHVSVQSKGAGEEVEQALKAAGQVEAAPVFNA